MSGKSRTILVSPIEQLCTCDDVPSRYYERDVYYDEEPFYYVLRIPSGRRRRTFRGAPFRYEDCCINCFGGMVYGTASCLATTVEIVAALLGGICRLCSGGP